MPQDGEKKDSPDPAQPGVFLSPATRTKRDRGAGARRRTGHL